MIRYIKILVLLVILPILYGCRLDEDPIVSVVTVTTSDEVVYEQNGVRLKGEIHQSAESFGDFANIVNKGFCFSLHKNPTISDNIQLCQESSYYSNSLIMEEVLTGLEDSKTYYARAFAQNDFGVIYGEEISFKTLKKANVAITSVKEEEEGKIKVTFELISEGSGDIDLLGICYSTNNNYPTYENDSYVLVKAQGLGIYSVEINVMPNKEYAFRSMVQNLAGFMYSETATIRTSDFDIVPGSDYEYVDLGLSVKWATMNVGATAPEDAGDYFAWGEVNTKSYYDWSTYLWCDGTSDKLTKYCSNINYGKKDDREKVLLSDDAAYINWDNNWRIPSVSELEELHKKCIWEWTTLNGVSGYKVKSKTNGNSIFLPAAGGRTESVVADAGDFGYYWSNYLFDDENRTCVYAYALEFSEDEIYTDVGYARVYGLSIRPVLNE